MGQDLGLDCQPDVFPLSGRFAEEDGIPVDNDGGGQVMPGQAVVLAIDVLCEGDTLIVPKLDWLARFVQDARAIADRPRDREVKLAIGRARKKCTASSGNSAASMPWASIPSAISPSHSPSKDQPSIAHSTDATSLSV